MKPQHDKTLVKLRSIIRDDNLIAGADLQTNLHFASDSAQGAKPNAIGVVFPESTKQLAQIVELCYREDLPMVPSGGRTGYSGGANAENGELVVSLNKMNKLIQLDRTNFTIHTQAGMITDSLATLALEESMYYPIKFAASGSSHIGGNVSTNAGGMQVIRYGSTRSWVAQLTVVTAGGEITTLGKKPAKHNSGLNLKELFIGAEGTLGFIAEVTMRLTVSQKPKSALLIALERFSQVIEVFSLTMQKQLVVNTFEFFCENSLEIVSDRHRLKKLFSSSFAYYVFVEFETDEDQKSRVEDFLNLVSSAYHHVIYTDDTVKMKELWRYRELISESIQHSFKLHKYDISLPLPQFDTFLEYIKKICLRHGLMFVVFGHIGDGNLHLNLLKTESMPDEAFRSMLPHLSDLIYQHVTDKGGSISAEHGIGLHKKQWLKKFTTRSEFSMMKNIKESIDPKNLFNRSKLF